MSTEVAIDALTAETSGLLQVCVSLKNDVSQLIADAVIVSENAAVIPLISMATNLIDTQALLATLITTR